MAYLGVDTDPTCEETLAKEAAQAVMDREIPAPDGTKATWLGSAANPEATLTARRAEIVQWGLEAVDSVEECKTPQQRLVESAHKQL